MDMPSWISAICAVITVIGAGISWWRSTLSKRAKEASEFARDEARRRLKAVEQTAAGVQQLANAVEEANSAPPPWKVRWQKGDRFELVNTGNVPLSNLQVGIDSDGEIFDPPSADIVDAKSSVVFMYSRHMGSDPNVSIVVTWMQPDGVRRRWKHPIPPHGAG